MIWTSHFKAYYFMNISWQCVLRGCRAFFEKCFQFFVFENIQLFFGVPFRWSMQILKLTLLAYGVAILMPSTSVGCITKFSFLLVHSSLEFKFSSGHLLTKVKDCMVIFSKYLRLDTVFSKRLHAFPLFEWASRTKNMWPCNSSKE